MTDHRTKFIHQTHKLRDWLEDHMYDGDFTQEKAQKALTAFSLVWKALDRRQETRRGPYEHK